MLVRVSASDEPTTHKKMRFTGFRLTCIFDAKLLASVTSYSAIRLMLSNLNLNPVVLAALESRGFHRVDDLRLLSNVQILSIPNVGGASYKRILAALGRKPSVGGPTWKRRAQQTDV
jgi:hypothetical protein